MIKREWSLLFSEYDLSGVLQAQGESIRGRIAKVTTADFEETSDEFLAATIASELVIAPLEVFGERIEVSTKEVKIDVSHDFGRATNPFGPTYVDGLEVTYHLPFAGDARLLRCRPSQFTMNPPRAVIARGELRFPYDSPDRAVHATKSSLTEDLGKIKQWLNWVNSQVSTYNLALEPAVQHQVASRRQELERTMGDIQSLGFKVRDAAELPSVTAPASRDEAVKHRAARRAKARREFDVALSFAGEDRDYVEAVAKALTSMDVTVFYDRFEQVNLWGKDLAEHLGQVYGKDSRFVVLFASRHYAAKAWPNHEKSFALGRHLKGDTGRILPVRFDDTEIPGLPPTIAHLDLRALRPDQLAELIRQKVDLGTTEQPGT